MGRPLSSVTVLGNQAIEDIVTFDHARAKEALDLHLAVVEELDSQRSPGTATTTMMESRIRSRR